MSGALPAASSTTAAGLPAAGPAGDTPGSLRWVALGDSFTAGTDPSERGWTELVIADVAPALPLELVNLARVGASIEELEGEQLPGALAGAPDLVTLICGGNDVIGRVRPDLDRFGERLGNVVERIRAEFPEVQLLTATYPPIAGHALRPRTRRRIRRGLDALNAIIRDTAGGLGARCVELAEHPGREDVANYAADGIHPSPAGHRAAAAVIGPVVEELLQTQRNDEEGTR